MNKINYQKELDKILALLKDNNLRPRLLLHSCCAPCSSYCITYLREYFDITCYYYNPNITSQSEYEKRYSELVRLVELVNNEPLNNSLSPVENIKVIDGGFDDKLFYEKVKGYENIPEGRKRCELCFYERLERTAQRAKADGYDYFTTTLTISPLKDEQLLNSIGRELSRAYDIPYLFSDFKKRGGYLESIKLSEKYGLYRQDYCGCVYSLRRDYVKE